MNKNVIVLIVLVAVLVAMMWFYAIPQWRKYNPKVEPAPMMPGGPGMMPGETGN